MITAREADGPLGRLRVEKTWQPVGFDDGEVLGYVLSVMSATLDGETIIWPQSQEIAESYAAADPEFRTWLDGADEDHR